MVNILFPSLDKVTEDDENLNFWTTKKGCQDTCLYLFERLQNDKRHFNQGLSFYLVFQFSENFQNECVMKPDLSSIGNWNKNWETTEQNINLRLFLFNLAGTEMKNNQCGFFLTIDDNKRLTSSMPCIFLSIFNQHSIWVYTLSLVGRWKTFFFVKQFFSQTIEFTILALNATWIENRDDEM